MSSSQKNALSLSLRDGEGIKHYRIRRLDNGGYYIASRSTFQNLIVSASLILRSSHRPGFDHLQCEQTDWGGGAGEDEEMKEKDEK